MHRARHCAPECTVLWHMRSWERHPGTTCELPASRPAQARNLWLQESLACSDLALDLGMSRRGGGDCGAGCWAGHVVAMLALDR
jgi:hypothetical protein